ncbi:MAG: LysE family translocator [Saprospiraceae bacterium]
MKSLIEGIQTGLILCFLIGPIFFTLLQTGVERGFRAGAMVGLGIWMSDLTYILVFYSGVSQIDQLIRGDKFSFYIGVLGGIVLISFGAWALFTKPALASHTDLHLRPSSSYVSLWAKGFFINALNPFAPIFWFTIVSAAILRNASQANYIYLYFTGVIATVAATDLLKVLLAKRIRHWLQPVHILWFRRVSGIALIIFGIVLMVKTIYFPESLNNGH